MNGLAKLNVFSATECKWEILFPTYRDKDSKFKGRYGFEGVTYNNKIYFFFGC